ncbi:hypothetical protein BOTBODRAFT_192495 [Botryobasidium botryosum FD-172 SS1]|uniref:Uncharacterized protein n=1 Tax=Botryobasidium botryosum (strain FD-172 SS1) TaxID=930990 RepID=A0A067M6S7_BOTB1|nr:hypothetical protein BOTBODRAFT_192495 [Botryobasidium botryosum FD-172 SS1]
MAITYDSSRLVATLPLSPPVLSALARCGFETVHDIRASSLTAVSMAEELSLPLDTTAHIINMCSDNILTASPRSSASQTVPSSQPVPASSQVPTEPPLPLPLPSLPAPILKPGHALEISGPPGSGRSTFALEIVREALDRDDEIIILDTQGAFATHRIAHALSDLNSTTLNLIHHVSAYALHTLHAFFHTLSAYLDAHPKIRLLVLSCISVLLPSSLSSEVKSHALAAIKQSLTRASATHNIMVVSTMQMVTKLFTPDGQPGNFTNSTRGLMAPQLGEAYLPTNKSTRIVLTRDIYSGVRHARTILIPPSLARANALPSATPLSVEASKNKTAKMVEFEIGPDGRVRELEL